MSLYSFTIKTQRREGLINITQKVREVLNNLSVKDGICVIYVPHTTAAILINEAADPDVAEDIIRKLSTLVPLREDYRHQEGNSDAHIKASIIGNSRIVIIQDGRLMLGTWEGIFLAEFDGPRTRTVFVKVI